MVLLLELRSTSPEIEDSELSKIDRTFIKYWKNWASRIRKTFNKIQFPLAPTF